MSWILLALAVLIGINILFFGVLWLIATYEEWRDDR